MWSGGVRRAIAIQAGALSSRGECTYYSTTQTCLAAVTQLTLIMVAWRYQFAVAV